MKLFQMIVMISSLCWEPLLGQINTESMRLDNLLPGIHHKMNLDEQILQALPY